jgi:hypothetical protein
MLFVYAITFSTVSAVIESPHSLSEKRAFSLLNVRMLTRTKQAFLHCFHQIDQGFDPERAIVQALDQLPVLTTGFLK